MSIPSWEMKAFVQQYPPRSVLGCGLKMPPSPSPARGVLETHSWMKADTSGLYSHLAPALAGLLPPCSRLLRAATVAGGLLEAEMGSLPLEVQSHRYTPGVGVPKGFLCCPFLG